MPVAVRLIPFAFPVAALSATTSAVRVSFAWQAPPASAPNLAFLTSLVGKNVNDAKVLDHPVMVKRLAAVLGKDAALVKERFQTAGTSTRAVPSCS